MATFVFLSGCAYGDCGGGQQPAQISRQLVRSGHQVFHGQPHTSPKVFADGVVEVPCPRHLQEGFWSAGAKGATEYWRDLLAGLGTGGECQLVVCCPIPWYVRAADVARALGWRIVYFIIDDWEHLYEMEKITYFRRDDERRLTRDADVILVTARSLMEKVGDKRVTVIPNGYDTDDFPFLTRHALESTERLSVIYWGYMRGEWFDWELFNGLVQARPQWEFHMIGPAPEPPPSFQNAMLHGVAPVHWLSRLSSIGDVAIIPFKPGPLIDAVDPIKAYEYLACGLPIVSCRMPQLDGWPGVTQVPSVPILWAEAIEAAAKRGIDPDMRAAHLKGRSWRDRTEAMLAAIGDISATTEKPSSRRKRGA